MDDKLMSPAASPVRVNGYGQKTLVLAVAAVALIAGVIVYVIALKQQQANAAPASDDQLQPRLMAPETPRQIAARLIQAKPVAPPSSVPAANAQTSAPVMLVASIDEEHSMPQGAGGPRVEVPAAAALPDDEEKKERRAALRRALSGSTVVPLNQDRAKPAEATGVAAELDRVRRERASLANSSDPTLAYQQAIKAAMAVQGAGPSAIAAGSPVAEAAGLPPPPLPPGPLAVGQYNRPGSADRFRLNAVLEPPASPFILQAGRVVIPCVLDSAVNSELPGAVWAHVALDVYDSTTGRHLLVPQGARLFGEYASGVVFGQSRLMIAWQRIIMPGGETIDIGEMPGADGVGRSGFADQVDNHYFRLFTSALLLSGVTAGIALSQDNGQNQMRPTAGSAMSQAVGQQLGQTTAQLIQKNMNVAPTLDIRPGYRFNVVVTKDVVFPKPYRSAR